MKVYNIIKSQVILSVSIVLLTLFSGVIFFKTKVFYNTIEAASLLVRKWFGHFYLWLGLLCVLFLVGLAISPFGKIKLGNQPPEFSRWSWIAMLYSAGMGAGILLRAVQEPVFMFLNPPLDTGVSKDLIALEYTFYQWGFTAWAFYGVFALIIGYYLFVKKKSVLLSNALPQLKAFRRYKPFKGSVDVLTILTTVCGLVAAVGLGTTQIEGGLSHLFSIENTLLLTLSLVIIILIAATFSAYLGLEKGIRRLSNWNIYVTLALLVYIMVQSDMIEMATNLLSSTYHYIIDFIPMSLAIGKFDPGLQFLTDWTFYYWAFWLAWAPFTGIFIARISKGRRIREMIFGVLIIPSVATFIWFSVFGSASFNIINQMATYNKEFDNVFTSIFVFFESYPFSGVLAIVTIGLLISFLITSVDSAIFVLSMFTDKGNQNPKKRHFLIWGFLLMVCALAIIILGSAKPDTDVLKAMQKLLILTSLPFAFITVLIVGFFIKDLTRK